MDESQSKKLKIAGLIALIIAGLGYGAYAMFAGGPDGPGVQPPAKVDQLKEQYQKVEKQPEITPTHTGPPSRAPRQVGS